MKTALLLPILFLFTISTLSAQGPACRTEAKIDQVQAQYGLSGKGVLTVMMDRGIDYRHPDFIDANGNTRIAYIFDPYNSSGANDPDNPYGIGTIFDSTEINAALQNGGTPITNDLFGHGTATTGIMSGNGSAVSQAEQFRGVAYNARIISIVVTKDFVPPFGNSSGQPGEYDPNVLPTAFQFAKDKIAELDMPFVTLLNIGSVGDPTDGQIEFCDEVEDYVNSGHPFVCGVGDDGGKDNHMIATLVENQSTEFVIEKGETGNVRFTAWYAESDRVDLTIQRPSGQVEGPFSPPTGPNDAADQFLNQIFVFHRGADAEFALATSNLRQLLIDISAEPGTYTITLNATSVSSDGQVNAFLNPSLFSNDNAFANNTNPGGGNINPFSACPATISPGDYVATDSWTDINGVQRMKVDEGAPGELWIGSSVGPTMDGRLGIDLVAPGEIAWAAYGEDSFYGAFDFNTLENSQGFYGIQTAVSAAAPITTGVIALMLEVNPELTPAEIKSLLQETARTDSFTGMTPNNEWGYGKLDALAVIEATQLTVDAEEPFAESLSVKLNPNPTQHTLQVLIPSLSEQAIPVKVFSLTGQVMFNTVINNGDQIDLSELSAGVYFLQIAFGENVISRKVVKQ